MIDRELFGERSVQLSVAALVLSLVFGAWELTRAVRIDPVGEGTPLRFSTAEALMGPEPTTPSDIVSVVALNVLSPVRKAPARRYQLSGYAEIAAAPELPKPVVLGVGLSTPERTFAICTVSGGPPTIVRVGNIIGSYTVKSIDRGSVEFASPTGERITIPATRP